MKRKFTLVSLMLLIATFASGQNAYENKQHLFPDARTEMNEKAYDKQQFEIKNGQLSTKTSHRAQNPLLKSAQAIKLRLDSLVTQNWDKSTSQWVASEKEEYIYDANNLHTQMIWYFWIPDAGKLVKYYKREYSYDDNGNNTQIIQYGWITEPNQWEAEEKYDYTYDDNGCKISETFYLWDPSISQWVGMYLYVFFYEAGNNTKRITYSWNESNSQWETTEKHEYTYDANGNETQFIRYVWDPGISQWVNYVKGESSYDANGNIILYLGYMWDESTSQWEGFIKDEYTYDDNGNLEQYICYSRSSNTSPWCEMFKFVTTNDNNYSADDLILPNDEYFKYKRLSTIRTHWHSNINDWVNVLKQSYYYSEQILTDISDVEDEKIGLFPNPVSDNINFCFTGNVNIAVFELYDTQGRKLLTKQISNNDRLNLDFLNSGTYLYNIYLDGNKQSGTLIKQ